MRRLKSLTPDFLLRAYERELEKERHINRALGTFSGPRVYVEIGVRDGACIRQIRSERKLAIDPAPISPSDLEKDGASVFRMTSDQFFESAAPSELAPGGVHVALADGLHEFRQTLRDVLNLERYMHPRGFIFIHDCNPPTRRHAEDMHGPWNGDVWKVQHYLRKFRRDLTCFTLDCDWGLGIVSGFSRTHASPRDEDVESVAALDYEVLARDREEILGLKSPLISRPWFRSRRLARIRS